MSWTSRWPTLRAYEPPHLSRIAMPLGGIGAGSISIGGRGDLRDWELFNRPSKGFIPCALDVSAGVMLHTRLENGTTDLRMAEGPLDDHELAGCVGATAPNHGVPRFRECRFEAAYPLAQVSMQDKDAPVEVQLRAFSPVVPADADCSSLPIIELKYRLHNRSKTPVQTSLIFNLPNPAGLSTRARKVLGNGRIQYETTGTRANHFRRTSALQGLFFEASEMNEQAENHGTMAVVTHPEADVSYRTTWLGDRYRSALLDLRNDLDQDGRLSECESAPVDVPVGSLALHENIAPGESRECSFFIAWHFPNRWIPRPEEEPCNVGNWYTAQHLDAWDAAERIVPQMTKLEEKTVSFVNTVTDCDLPLPIKEAMLCNLSTLFTETCYRLPDGRLCSFEGCGNDEGYCLGSCTHVWNYEHTLPYLFGDLARSMRRAEFLDATSRDGAMSFRILHPHNQYGQRFGKVAADGQMGCILKAYREWRLSGDKQFLDELWPAIRRAMEYCWIAGGWDADQDGVMEGCQHNTMDVEYYGPNPQMQCWYLGALRAVAEMARTVGCAKFANHCEQLYRDGREWTETHLFNGEYYEHELRLPPDSAEIPEGQRLFDDKPVNENHQLLDACLLDQLVGQNLAYACGLGHVLSPEQQRSTLQSILRYNTRPRENVHFNPMRTFAYQDEPGLLMASFPRGNRPEFPFPYFAETMSGFEYTAAVGMIYAGLREEGLKCISQVRQRHDGKRRNPFDEPECGHHYVRAMACWLAAIAWTGFDYAAEDACFTVDGLDGKWFWSNGHSWGHYELRGNQVHLTVSANKLVLAEFNVRGRGLKRWPKQQYIKDEIKFELETAE